MIDNPFVTWAVVGIVTVASMSLFASILNLAQYATMRPPRLRRFAAVRHRALGLQQLLLPALLALGTGLIISMSATYLTAGFREPGAGDDTLIGLALLVAAFLLAAVIGAFLLTGGVEIADLAKDPVTITSAAGSLTGAAPDDAAALADLRTNLAEWRRVRGVRAFFSNRDLGDDALNSALDAVIDARAAKLSTSIRYLRPRLLMPVLRAFPSMLLGPLTVISGLVIALVALQIDPSRGSLQWAGVTAAVVTMVLLAFAATVFHWWSKLLCAVRQYADYRSYELPAAQALDEADARITGELARRQGLAALPARLDMLAAAVSAPGRRKAGPELLGAVAVGAVTACTALLVSRAGARRGDR
ncbi:hypothetical protein [Microbacterium esteraromaticum]|uniref:hypothetical protein n=1 Tax=Microbacterium esteraromaticum TaxID=57043 RepID=UPI00195DB284|nr:hypothetical protein [Microbacterium esteraromaticum]MBM7465790.1 hypothetical protein [Microbacterium esteraromaticum]